MISWLGGLGKEALGTNYSVKFGALVALRSVLVVLALAGAELAEVLGCLGDDIFEEFKGYPAQGLAWVVLVG